MTKQKTVGEMLGISVTDIMLMNRDITYVTDMGVASPEAIVGLELEIENVPHPRAVQGVHLESDGSLRNSGIEFITSPFEAKYVGDVVQTVLKINGITKSNYSERCSVHVHLNVCDMTLDQVSTLTSIYSLFERTMFKFVGGGRDNNIFCVPWYNAVMPTFGANVPRYDQYRRWHKYLALNLSPMFGGGDAGAGAYGTVEFRHMGGTCDVREIVAWVNIITSIRDAAMSINNKAWTEMLRDPEFTYEHALQLVFKHDETHDIMYWNSSDDIAMTSRIDAMLASTPKHEITTMLNAHLAPKDNPTPEPTREQTVAGRIITLDPGVWEDFNVDEHHRQAGIPTDYVSTFLGPDAA